MLLKKIIKRNLSREKTASRIIMNFQSIIININIKKFKKMKKILNMMIKIKKRMNKMKKKRNQKKKKKNLIYKN
jgi:hypothetical protein